MDDRRDEKDIDSGVKEGDGVDARGTSKPVDVSRHATQQIDNTKKEANLEEDEANRSIEFTEEMTLATTEGAAPTLTNHQDENDTDGKAKKGGGEAGSDGVLGSGVREGEGDGREGDEEGGREGGMRRGFAGGGNSGQG